MEDRAKFPLSTADPHRRSECVETHRKIMIIEDCAKFPLSTADSHRRAGYVETHRTTIIIDDMMTMLVLMMMVLMMVLMMLMMMTKEDERRRRSRRSLKTRIPHLGCEQKTYATTKCMNRYTLSVHSAATIFCLSGPSAYILVHNVI